MMLLSVSMIIWEIDYGLSSLEHLKKIVSVVLSLIVMEIFMPLVQLLVVFRVIRIMVGEMSFLVSMMLSAINSGLSSLEHLIMTVAQESA